MKRIYALVMVLGLVGAMLAGCGEKAAEGADANAAANTPAAATN